MKEDQTIFTIPTYRLRDVAETIEKYDEHFARNGHAVKMMVFDDSSLANHEKYYALLEQTKTVNDLYYVGPEMGYSCWRPNYEPQPGFKGYGLFLKGVEYEPPADIMKFETLKAP